MAKIIVQCELNSEQEAREFVDMVKDLCWSIQILRELDGAERTKMLSDVQPKTEQPKQSKTVSKTKPTRGRARVARPIHEWPTSKVILEAMANGRNRTWTTSEMQRLFKYKGFASGSARSMLSQLTEAGYLFRNARGEYTLLKVTN